MFNAYTVYTYGGGEALYEAFNAIAAMTGGSDYLTLIKLFGVLSLFWVIIEMGVHKTVNWHWFLMFMVMFNVFFVPKKPVTIIDRMNPAATYVVANVPFGLAAPAWLFSTIGDGLTTLTEQFFSLPTDMQYHKTGMVFGSKMMTSINKARFDDPLLNKNLDQYAKQCIYYNIAYGFYSFGDIIHSNNLQSLLFSTTNNSNIRRIYYDNGGTQLSLTCSQAASQLVTDMTPVVDSMLGKYANMLFSNEGGTTASRKAHIISALPLGYSFFSGISVTAQQQLMQASIANYMENSYGKIAASANATAAATAYATSVAERQQRSTWRTMGELSARALPIMHTVFEILIYSLFFLVFLALLLPMSVSGKALSTWFKMIIWIQLWPVLYAILNMVVSVYGKVATSLAVSTGSITSMAGMMGMAETHSDMAMIAGYLAMSIPVLAWSLVSMSGQVMGTLAGGLMSPGSQAAGQASGEVSRGNISTGNASMGNKSIMQDMTGPNTNISSNFNDGITSQTFGSNRMSEQLGVSNMGVSASSSQGVQHATTQALNKAQAQERMYGSSYAKAQANESTAAHQFVQQAMHSNDKGLQEQVTQATGGNTNFESSNQIAHNFAKEHGLTDSEGANVLMQASLKASEGLNILGNGVQLQGDITGRGEINSKESEAFKDAISSGDAEKYAESVSIENKLADIASTHTSDASSTSGAQSLADAHKNTETAQQNWSDSAKKVDQLQEAEQFTQSQAFNTDANMNQYLEDYIRDKGMNIGKDDIAGRMEVANSDEFAEYALHKTGRDIDLNEDGKVEGWHQTMDEKASSTGKHVPEVSSKAPHAAEDAMNNAGLTPGETHGATSDKVSTKITEGEEKAEQQKKTLEQGHVDVHEKGSHVKNEVQEQNTATAARVAGLAGEQVMGYVGKAFKGAMEHMPTTITKHNDEQAVSSGTASHPIEVIQTQGPKMGDGGFNTSGSATIQELNQKNEEGAPTPEDSNFVLQSSENKPESVQETKPQESPKQETKPQETKQNLKADSVGSSTKPSPTDFLK